jgi:hypothetical protein
VICHSRNPRGDTLGPRGFTSKRSRAAGSSRCRFLKMFWLPLMHFACLCNLAPRSPQKFLPTALRLDACFHMHRVSPAASVAFATPLDSAKDEENLKRRNDAQQISYHQNTNAQLGSKPKGKRPPGNRSAEGRVGKGLN